MAKQPSKSRASKNGKAAKGKTAKSVESALVPQESAPVTDIMRADPDQFDLYKIGVACALSPCPEDIVEALKKAGWNLGGGTCIETVYVVMTKEALDGSEPHNKLLLDQLGEKKNGTNININQTCNTMNVNYADQDQKIADIFRGIPFEEESPGTGG